MKGPLGRIRWILSWTRKYTADSRELKTMMQLYRLGRSVVWRTFSPQWILNVELRIELIIKFATQNVQNLEPLELLMAIG